MSISRSDVYVFLGERIQQLAEKQKALKKQLKKKEIDKSEYQYQCTKLTEQLVKVYEDNWDDDLEW